MRNNPNFQSPFVILAQDWEVSLTPNIQNDLERFTCCLYGSKIENVNIGIIEQAVLFQKKRN